MRRVFAVLPVWNEVGSVVGVLEELNTLPAGTLAGVIVVDGGSTDGTPTAARERGATVIAQTRRGYGAACYEGYRAAREAGASDVLFLDGDGSDPPAAAPALLAPLLGGAADLVLGVRCAPPGERSAIPWHARAGNRLVCALLRQRTGRSVSDLPSMKALGVSTLDRLGLTQMGFGWTTELIARALQSDLRVREVAVTVRPRTAGRSKVSGNAVNSARAAYALVRTAITATGRG